VALSVKRTLVQFGGEAAAAVAEAPATASLCPTCNNHFSADARFCPYDGEALGPAPDWDPLGDPLLGAVIDGRYEVLEVLGEGGMGTVYRARHAALGRSFAIKALRRDLAQDSELAARFIQEAKAAAAVSHPSVVQITDFGALPSGQPYFVMELLEGRTLSRILREQGSLPPERAARIARQVAEALAAAHAVGIIHRDLKPDNVQIAVGAGAHEMVKVLDFGLAKVAGASRLTRQGMVFGTPHYMSPEQAAGEPIDHRVDIYALGVVLYELLTGRLPFEADSFMGVLTKHIYMEPPPPSRLLTGGAELGPLEQITMRCLAKQPANRFADMQALIAELDRIPSIGTHSTLPAPPLTSERPPRSFARPGWPLLLGAGALLMVLLLLLGLGVWGLAGRAKSEPSVASSGGTAPTPSAPAPGPAASQPVQPSLEPTVAAAEPALPDVRPAATRPGTRPGSARPAPAGSAPRAKPRPGSSDIVNPWAE
jgi:eukaryotic-like serine/threonine-protein kinase